MSLEAALQTASAVTETPETASAVKTEPVSPKLLDIAKREQAAVKRMQLAKQQSLELSKREQMLQAQEEKYKKWEQDKQNALLNPLDALQGLGLSYEQLTEFYLNQKKPTPELQVGAVRQDFERYKQQQEQKEKERLQAEQEMAQAEVNETIENFKTSLSEFITSHPDDYELIHAYGAEPQVYAKIEAHFKETQKILSMKESADLVEKEITEWVEKASKTKKLASKFAPVEAKAEEKKSSGSAPSKTLNNQMSSSAPSFLSTKNEDDRMKRALAALG